MNYLALAVSGLIGLALVHSGLSKLRPDPPILDTLTGLGFLDSLVLPLAHALGLTEIVLAFAIVVWFSSLSAGLVFLIGLGFALVGGFAAVKGLHVPCNCFGEHHRSYLGWRQIVIAPLWGIPLCIQLVFNPAQFGLATKLALFVALLLVQIGLLLSEFVQTLRGELAIPWLRPSR